MGGHCEEAAGRRGNPLDFPGCWIVLFHERIIDGIATACGLAMTWDLMFRQPYKESMIELRGKYAQAHVFTDVVDQESISQVISLLNQPYAAGSRVRMMPDIHAGAG